MPAFRTTPCSGRLECWINSIRTRLPRTSSIGFDRDTFLEAHAGMQSMERNEQAFGDKFSGARTYGWPAYLRGCKPRGSNHSLRCATVSFARALFNKASRSVPGGKISARSLACRASSSRRCFSDVDCLNRRRVSVIANPSMLQTSAREQSKTDLVSNDPCHRAVALPKNEPEI